MMNERIRQLAEQAGIIPGIMGLNRFTYFDPEKFAQLIVRECMTNLYLNGYDDAMIQIQQHFGAES